MSELLVTLTVENGLARLTLNSPATGNAMDLALLGALAQATQALLDAPPRAVLLRGAGKNFCVGGDIRAFASAPAPAALLREMADSVHVSVRNLAALPAPVLAVVQGAAAGAGLSLAAGADILLAGSGASFAMAYTGIGLSADGGASYILPRLIGLRRTQELAYTNRRISAAEALAWGLVTQVVEDAALDEAAEALAQRLASGPTRAYANMKRLFASGADLCAQLDLEAEAISEAASTADGREGVAAFLARRKPAYTGS